MPQIKEIEKELREMLKNELLLKKQIDYKPCI